jgi:transcriptional regulator of acetoin/glycerol metabolism
MAFRVLVAVVWILALSQPAAADACRGRVLQDLPRVAGVREEPEKRHIARVLASVNGSRARAAALLGISRSTLWEKAKRYGLA